MYGYFMNVLNYLRSIDQDTLYLIVGGIATIIALTILDLTTTFIKVKRRAKKKIKVEGPIIDELNDKLTIISNHASMYANSLGAEGAKLLFELKSLIEEQAETLEMLQACIDTDSIEDIQAYYKHYDDLTPKQKIQWITRSNHLIDLLGKRIYDVSERSTNMGIPKVKRKENTIDSLRRWNIIK